jgi:hypothetical protein
VNIEFVGQMSFEGTYPRSIKIEGVTVWATSRMSKGLFSPEGASHGDEIWKVVVPTPYGSAGVNWLGRITASSEYAPDHSIAGAFDGIGNSRWATTANDPDPWIRIELPEPTLCDFVLMRTRTDGCWNQAPTRFAIWGSTDGVVYYKLASIATTWTQGEWKRIPFANSGRWKEYKITMRKPQGGPPYIALGQLNIGSRS